MVATINSMMKVERDKGEVFGKEEVSEIPNKKLDDKIAIFKNKQPVLG